LVQRWLKPNLRQTRDWFALLPTVAYASVTFTQVADHKGGPTSVIAFFAMGLPTLLALIRWGERGNLPNPVVHRN
jgi:uncharacterized membrane protein YfbV (UPF0208 family)